MDERPERSFNIPAGAFTGNLWSREQVMLAFYLYCQTPFGQLHSRNKKIITLANLIGRTPGALAMKCTNLASLDPAIVASGRVGLTKVSALDREVWGQFCSDWDGLAAECEVLLAYLNRAGADDVLLDSSDHDAVEAWDFTGDTTLGVVQRRRRQQFFRRMVLTSYRERCCISGVSEVKLLVASHIVPWREDRAIRLDPSNGLCLSSIHDRAFDAHLFSFSDDCRVVLSPKLKNSNDEFLRQVFWSVEGKAIDLPDRFHPNPGFIARHRDVMLGNTERAT